MSEFKFKATDVRIINVITPDTFEKMKLTKCYIFTEDVMRILNIEKMIPTDKEENKDKKEVWAFCRFDKGGKEKESYIKEKRYLISTFGRVYDIQKRRLKKQSDTSNCCKTASGEKYRQINFTLNDKHYLYQVHRLVASTFIVNPNKYYTVVDHIDEHPYNNYVWNLQWTDKSSNANKHNNWVGNVDSAPKKTTWSIKDIEEICHLIADGHKATYIYNTLHEKHPENEMITYERIRTMYKHIMKRGDFHEIALKCGVIFDKSGKPDYSKEQASIKRVADLKKDSK